MKTENRKPKTENRKPIDWKSVKSVLVVRLRSIGDTVLSTPSLIALRRFLPAARIDVLLEDWVAPVLEGFEAVDHVLTVSRGSKKSRLAAAWRVRRNKYDVVFNLHGGTTATFFVRASGARHLVGYSYYQYKFLYNHLLSSSADFWRREPTHSAEQQLALLGAVGVPVEDCPKSRLDVTDEARKSVADKLKLQITNDKLENSSLESRILNPQSEIRNPKSHLALFHPAAATATKQWATENFARVADFLGEKGFQAVAVGTKKERAVLEKLKNSTRASVLIFDDLSLPEITALAARADLFVGNDSGIAHIAAAVETPSVVVFGSSNRHHWRPWTNAPHEIVYEKMHCQPCAGFFCKEFGEPQCILSVKIEDVAEAIESVLSAETVSSIG